jgi:hypothetical protein
LECAEDESDPITISIGNTRAIQFERLLDHTPPLPFREVGVAP